MKARYGKKGVKRGLSAGGKGEVVQTYVSKRGSRGTTHAPPEKPRTDFIVRNVNGMPCKVFVYRCRDCRMYFWGTWDWMDMCNYRLCYECMGCTPKDPKVLRPLTNKEESGYFKYLAAKGIRVSQATE